MIDLEDFRTKLGLELLGPTTKKQLDINVTDINRPGMQFCGFYEYFAHERVQVIGKVEMTYLESLESRMRRPVLEKYMSYPIPCIITCWGMTPPRDRLEIARAHDAVSYTHLDVYKRQGTASRRAVPSWWCSTNAT